MAGGRRGVRRPVPDVEVDEGRRQVPLSTFYSASQGQDDAKGLKRRPRKARRPPSEPKDGARGTEDDDEVLLDELSGGCEGQPTETEDNASGAGSSGRPLGRRRSTCEAPHDSLSPPLPQNRPVIRPQGRM
jgi:hypothetical protein